MYVTMTDQCVQVTAN